MKKQNVFLIFAALLLMFTTNLSATPRSGGTFNWVAPYGGDFFSLDPHISSRTQDYLALLNNNSGLYKWSADAKRPVLDLAEEATVSDDGLTYTYKLRKNVKFHNGRPMVADDVIWSLTRIMDAKTASPCARYVRVIKGAKDMETGKSETVSGLVKIDDYTVAITYENVIDPAYSLFEPCVSVLPKEEVEARGTDFAINPVGCGPFEVKSWKKGSELVMEKFDDFYLEGRPYLDKLVYNVMPEGAARDIGFRNQELDATIVGSAQYPAYLKDPVISKNLVEVAEMFTRHMGFNTNFKPFADKRVRQAINYAINDELIIEKLLKGKAFAAVSFLPTTSTGFNPELKAYGYDVEKAKQLMKEAGYEDGFEFTCIATNSSSFGAPIVESLIPFLKKINVTIKLQQLEGAALSEKVFKTADFDAYTWSISSGADPLQALSRFHSENPRSGGNLVMYSSPEFDGALDQAELEMNSEKKIALIQKADAIFLEDAPLWFFNYNKAIIAHHPWVHGIKPVAVEHMYQDFTDIWVDDSSPRATK
jgi:peptide/nickel transport system substrate-binding protein